MAIKTVPVVQAETNGALQSTNQSTIANGRHLPATVQQIYCFEWMVIFKFRRLLIASLLKA